MYQHWEGHNITSVSTKCDECEELRVLHVHSNFCWQMHLAKIFYMTEHVYSPPHPSQFPTFFPCSREDPFLGGWTNQWVNIFNFGLVKRNTPFRIYNNNNNNIIIIIIIIVIIIIYLFIDHPLTAAQVSSVGSAPLCQAGGRGFKPHPDQQPGF